MAYTIDELQQLIPQNWDQLGNFTQTNPYFQNVANFHQQAPSQALMAQLGNRASGVDQPFTRQVTNQMIGADAGANARNFSMQQQNINRTAANNGMAGGGPQMAAMNAARSMAAGATRAARAAITSRAHLSNFQARERAQQQIQGYLQQQLQSQQFMASASANMQSQATQGKNQFLSQMRDTQLDEQEQQNQGSGGMNAHDRMMMQRATTPYKGMHVGSIRDTRMADHQGQQNYARNYLANKGISIT